jgi:hypothetical protein
MYAILGGANRSELLSRGRIARVIGRTACGRDRYRVRGQAEVFEDVGGDPGIRDEREDAQGIAAARTLGDLVAENPAQQRGPIEPAGERHRRGGRSDRGRRLSRG